MSYQMITGDGEGDDEITTTAIGGDDQTTLSTEASTTIEYAANKRESLFFAHGLFLVACVGTLGYLSYYTGYVWLMTKFPYRFTEWGIGFPRPVPGMFIDAGFSVDWVMISLMMFTIFPPLVGLWIMMSPTNWVRYDIQRFCLWINFALVLAVAAYMIGFVWIFKNGSSHYPLSFANPVDTCCKHHGAMAAAAGCMNNADCPDLPTVPPIRLHTDGVLVAHMYSLAILTLGILFQGIANTVFRRFYASPPPSSLQDTSTTSTFTIQGFVPFQLHLMNLAYVIYICFFLTCGVLVFDIRHMHEFPSTGPIGIQSARDGIEAGGIIATAITALLFPMFIMLLMYVIRTWNWRYKKWAELGLYAILVFIVAIHAFGFFTMMYSRGSANLPGYPNSLANHPLRCCAADTREYDSSQCDNDGPCDLATVQLVFPWFRNAAISSSQLPTNERHNVIFGMTFGLLAMDVIIVLYIFNKYFRYLLGMMPTPTPRTYSQITKPMPIPLGGAYIVPQPPINAPKQQQQRPYVVTSAVVDTFSGQGPRLRTPATATNADDGVIVGEDSKNK